MSELRQIAVVYDYDGLMEAVRGQVARLNLSCTTIDTVSGVTNGYAGKLLCDPPIKGLGRTSMGPILQTLGLCLIVAEDAEALKKLTPRLDERKPNGPIRSVATNEVVQIRVSRIKLKRLGRKGGKNRASKMTKKQRSQAARRAICVRWRRERKRQKARASADRAARTKRAVLPAVPAPMNLLRQCAGTAAAITLKP